MTCPIFNEPQKGLMMNSKSNELSSKNDKLNSFSTEMLKCPVCGTEYENTKKGRTKEYCSPNCQEFNKYKNAMEDKLSNINFNSNEAKLIKGELWRIANIIKIPSKKK